ncbi:MAG: UDP-3-O-acyl-N-acetylglucosamine deacetylase [Myxococcales bacterium]|nr:UDP-3-O-acyl-N-acetylglucosamine deacetylase [Myxococcales bacterium]
MSGYVELHGRGLHSGARASIRFDARPGPLLFRFGDDEASPEQLTLVRTDHGVCLRARHGRHEVDLCEHMLAALAGLGLRSGVVVTVTGPEVPLLDGGAFELGRALATLACRREPPRLVVAERAELSDGSSSYVFEPGDSVHLQVEVDFGHGLGRQRAEHRGEPEAFMAEIAAARTFGFEHDAESLRRAGRARHVDPSAVVVLDAEGRVLGPSRPLEPNELARHKLLDLIGDLALYGGPPRGRVFADRPGHTATHRVVAKALASGLLRPI